MDKHETLRHYFGHDDFRPGQESLVDALLSGRDVVGVMPTGAGKSMCYQIPALMLPGVTLVISPLISLMKDQVAALKSAGVPAAYLNSSLTPRQMDLAMERAMQGQYKIIYVAPERLDTRSFQTFARYASISLIAVDEAHCVSQWGQDFRPNYLRIAAFVDTLPVRPVVGAFTATATERVRDDIIRMLALRDPLTTTTGFDRPNLFFEVEQPKSKYTALRAILRRKEGMSGIVYCATRKNVEEVTDKLLDEGFSVGRYHAGLSDEERRQSQEDFQYDRVQIMVATNAFGMGIDKSNVSFVIHYNMPKSMEAYYQEAGRAGRDGEPAECVMLYSGQDRFTAQWMIDHSEPNPEMTPEAQTLVRRQDLVRLDQMVRYSTSGSCLRSAILRYFGQEAPMQCGACSVCTGGRYAFVNELARVRRGRPVDSFDYSDGPGFLPMKPHQPAPPPDAPADPDDLFEVLRACRMAIAKPMRVPPYIVCDDKTLHDMVRRMPLDPDQLLQVHGMGVNKVGKYGEAFLAAIKGFLASHPDAARAAAKKASPTAIRRSAKKKPAVAVPGDNDLSERLRRGYLAGATIPQLAAATGVTEDQVRAGLRAIHLLAGGSPAIPDEPAPPSAKLPVPTPASDKPDPKPHPDNAGLPWSDLDDQQLKIAYLSGKSIRQLTELFGRTDNAIRSRLRRMNLIV